ncbi:L-2-hydroxyglutarate oxidase [Leptospira ilyithenensis]|uniref:L-2-hydroxyglutarate oxidase n=1 Tax=Leptospira ilyithenensis TaxID=2484901 RepID=A0A4R9LPU8_9LEPT|nr:L-2-hydroxyglutarate oxidase [Leptospira ilyithenensis]TGN07990.1 L-2-hydroxyglutarate oxidase [Leptospira ilyithenensis]
MKYDVVIIGAGVVGLSTAWNLLNKNRKLKLLVIEKESSFAKHQTSHNSGVIHSGIYYKPGSLKAQNCIEGYDKLIKFCNENEIPFELCGKIIVATDKSELPALENIYNRGLENGLKKLRKLKQDEIKEVEPHAAGVAGIFVPQTGIVDYLKFSGVLYEKILNLGGEVLFNQKVLNIRDKNPNEAEIRSTTNTYSSKVVITCGGLYSDKLASSTESVDFKIIPFRGEYYQLKPEKSYLVKTLIYPVPDPSFPFLGVHFTKRIDGSVEAGPNAVLAFAREGYKKSDINIKEFIETISFSGFHHIARKYWRTGLSEFYRSYSKALFVKALQKLIPEISKDDLIAGGSGVRAQACTNSGILLDDFHILHSKNKIHVCNAPSPAATSSLAIGSKIAAMFVSK